MNRTLAAGSYYRNDLSGASLGDAALPLADQTLLASLALTPTLTYTEWATQTGDVSWTTVTPATNYQAYSLTDLQLTAAASSALSVPMTLAVIAPTLTFASSLTTIFEGTPYAYQKTEAVYSQLDNGSPPQIYFLYWLGLRESTDPKIGNTSLNYAASQALGVLVYVLDTALSSSDRAIPATSFTQALSTQMTMPSVVVPATPAVQNTIPPITIPPISIPGVTPAPAVTPASASASSGDTAKAVLLVSLGVAAAVGAYRLYESRRT